MPPAAMRNFKKSVIFLAIGGVIRSHVTETLRFYFFADLYKMLIRAPFWADFGHSKRSGPTLIPTNSLLLFQFSFMPLFVKSDQEMRP